MKNLLRKIIPEQIILAYHYLVSVLAAFIYGFPAKKIIVIGVTGTKGKTSTANFIWSCLNASDKKAGIITTANVRIGDKEMINQWHMTMPGRFTIQRLLAQMVKEGCAYCVVETTSEGLKQYRHIGVYYDIAVFTNLTPEHLPSHGGSFDKYKQAKGRMFEYLTKHERKNLSGHVVEKVIVANLDSEHAEYYLSFATDKKITYGLKSDAQYKAENIIDTSEGVTFQTKGQTFRLGVLGSFNVYNALPAIAVAHELGVKDEAIRKGLASLKIIPGRMEKIDEGQPFTVLVDYAHEEQSINAVLDTANKMKQSGKVIIVLGAEGGGRDPRKRPIMGQAAGRKADVIICSNVDPYEDDPYPIANDIAVAAEAEGKIRGQDLFVILDRRQGIGKALEIAGRDDIILITGKGAEQSITVDGKTTPWDDREVARQELKKLKQN